MPLTRRPSTPPWGSTATGGVDLAGAAGLGGVAARAGVGAGAFAGASSCCREAGAGSWWMTVFTAASARATGLPKLGSGSRPTSVSVESSKLDLPWVPSSSTWSSRRRWTS